MTHAVQPGYGSYIQTSCTLQEEELSIYPFSSQTKMEQFQAKLLSTAELQKTSWINEQSNGWVLGEYAWDKPRRSTMLMGP
jgi:hypothetical protein